MNEELIEAKCQAFIKTIKSLREKKGLSTTDVANLTGLKQPNVSRIEGGAYMPNLPTLMKLAEALGVDLKFE